MTQAIFALKKFKADFTDAAKEQNGMAIAICVQNSFRPMLPDKERIEAAIKSLFKGATDVESQKSAPKGVMLSGVRPIAWAVFSPKRQDDVEKKLMAHIDALNTVYAYGR